MLARWAVAAWLFAAASLAQKSPAPDKRIQLTPEPAAPSGSERWDVQFLYDKNDSFLELVDLKFSSPQRGIAAGTLMDKGRRKFTALVTRDGGAKWDFVPLEDEPISLFLLDDAHGWLVSRKGLWQTDESGRHWRRVWNRRGLARVWFTSASRGFAIGAPKAVYETSDGGKTWRNVAAAGALEAKPETTSFEAISFATPNVGLIAGVSRPLHRLDPLEPPWINPRSLELRRQMPNLVHVLQTADGGKTWRPDTVSIFGWITSLSMAPDGRSLALIEFFDLFEVPSEVHAIDWKTTRSTLAFRRPDRSVTDVLVLANGPAWLAAIETGGRLYHTPVPGKLHMLVSDDLRQWRETEVDYRASGNRAVLASAGRDHVWVATNTGMILKLRP